jgi:hypothetical protein
MTTPMMTRRELLRGTIAGAGMIGLRSMVTGLPISFLLDPAIARAGDCTQIDKAQFLILSMSASGDALNCNVPGTYDLPPSFAAGTVNHSLDPLMAPTSLKLQGQSWTAAAPWASMPQGTLDRTVFFHHRTGTANHGELGRVFQLFGALRRGQWLPSYLAKNLWQCFGTVQPQPVTLGGELLSYEGRYLPHLTPTGLKAVLTGPMGLGQQLQALRDSTLTSLNNLFKMNRSKTTAERAFLDGLALSQTQLRMLIQQVSTDLAAITADDAPNQVLAATLLVKMNVTPLVSIHLPFSGDNHTDADFKNETAQHVASVANINLLMQKLKAYGLQDKVTFATLNVFGRQFDTLGGRGHNSSHSVSVIIGKAFKGGVVGGLLPGGHAADVDSKSGMASPSGDLSAGDSLASLAKTLGVGMGMTEAQVNDQITSGLVMKSALA